MKAITLIYFIFSSMQIFAQADSLGEIHTIRTKAYSDSLNNYVSLNVSYMDTLSNNRDSFVVHFISKTGKLLKVEKSYIVVSQWPTGNVYSKFDSSLTFYDAFQKEIYGETWYISIVSIYDTFGVGAGGFAYGKADTPILGLQLRTEYDNSGRVIFQVLSLSLHSISTRRYKTSYCADNTNSSETVMEEIPFYEFWYQ